MALTKTTAFLHYLQSGNYGEDKRLPYAYFEKLCNQFFVFSYEEKAAMFHHLLERGVYFQTDSHDMYEITKLMYLHHRNEKERTPPYLKRVIADHLYSDYRNDD